MTDTAAQTSGQERSVAIACQGGGSHTAFTAGVLSQLLNSDELAQYRIAALSGTSGGAVCALLAWSALLDDDRALASRMLEEFWADNAAKGLAEQFLNSWLLAASAVQNYGLMPAISPYHTPTSTIGLDQFRQMLQRHVNFDRFEADAAGSHPLLLLGAVDVMSGRFRAFNSREEQITADCGRVVRPRDPEALGAAILDVLGDMEVCQALSSAARERAANLFGIDRFRATHRAIYEVVLASRPGQSGSADADAEAEAELPQAQVEMELANA